MGCGYKNEKMKCGYKIERRTHRIVITPYPSSLLCVTRGGSPTWPQLRRQMMRGVGTPLARQEIVTVLPCSFSTLGGGGEMMNGAAENKKEMKDGCTRYEPRRCGLSHPGSLIFELAKCPESTTVWATGLYNRKLQIRKRWWSEISFSLIFFNGNLCLESVPTDATISYVNTRRIFLPTEELVPVE